jgi:CrcB protein
MQNILFIAAGGAIGASLRYLTGLIVLKLLGKNSVLTGTVFANMAGSFPAGFILALTAGTNFAGSPGYFFFSVGLIGSLTTFSTFILELITLLKNRSYSRAAAYLFVQIVGVLLITFLGFLVYNLLFEP